MTILNILFLLPLQINSGFLSRNMLQAFKYQARRISFSRRFLSSSSSSAPSDQNGNTIGTTTNESVSDTTKPIIINMKRRMKQRDGTGQPKGYYDDKYILETGLKSGRPPSGKPYLVLGIESSCDDTGASVVRSDGTILSNVIYSQYEIHQKFGGVVPSLAMEAHKSNIDKAVNEAIQQAGLTSVNDVDVIAVTKGPGLEVCLRVGLRKAQALAREFKKTFVTVHHLEAHCMTARLGGVLIKPENHSITGNLTSSIPTESSVTQNPTSSEYDKQTVPKVEFPFLTLLVSGGHTSIVLCNGLGNYTVLGGTLDDALGEAFDKVSRILGLESERSGGAAVEAQAAAYFNRNRHLSLNALKDELSSLNLRLPLLGKPNCDFSYSGTYDMLYLSNDNNVHDNYFMNIFMCILFFFFFLFCFSGLKNAFRMAVGSSRTRSGLQSDSTNAPSKDHQAVETIVVRYYDLSVSNAHLCSISVLLLLLYLEFTSE